MNVSSIFIKNIEIQNNLYKFQNKMFKTKSKF